MDIGAGNCHWFIYHSTFVICTGDGIATLTPIYPPFLFLPAGRRCVQLMHANPAMQRWTTIGMNLKQLYPRCKDFPLCHPRIRQEWF